MASRGRPRAADPDSPGRSVSRPAAERGKIDGEAGYQRVPATPDQFHQNFDPQNPQGEAVPPTYPESGLVGVPRGLAGEVTRPPLGAPGGTAEALEREAVRLWKSGHHRQALAEISAAADRTTGKPKQALRKVADKMVLLLEWEVGFENRERKAQLLATRAILDAEIAALE